MLIVIMLLLKLLEINFKAVHFVLKTICYKTFCSLLVELCFFGFRNQSVKLNPITITSLCVRPSVTKLYLMNRASWTSGNFHRWRISVTVLSTNTKKKYFSILITATGGLLKCIDFYGILSARVLLALGRFFIK